MKEKFGFLQGVFFGVLFVSPIVIYASQFGLGVWRDHSKWAEMGSALSGIYSPLIALLAFFILIKQVRSQADMNKYQYDQSFVSEARKDIDFYVGRIDAHIDDVVSNERSAREVLKYFSALNESELRTEQCREYADRFISDNRKVYNLWVAIYPILEGLHVNKEFPYEHAYSSALIKISSVLSFQTCIGLEKVYYSSNSKVEKHYLIFWKG
ncbi:Uncharacterised protein [BD1-7 clade bacterium]|uniref:Uncharacterized protein n=1 Tax=BD1-7 clade bacterium TaxID=2029982 RepID=A0A5S9QPB8_9GAMM|nr:Uncharacterised protein [BD1-7 clade bacterium]